MARIAILRRPRGVLADLVTLDCKLFARVAGAHTPWLDRALPLLSRSANHSALWAGIGACLSAAGGRRGRRAAVRGMASIGVTSLFVNQGVKRVVRRPRPAVRNVPAVRRVGVAPLTTSFPSGHAASAAAFATAVAIELPKAGGPLAVLAAVVGASRVYVGVHYPLDVAVGAGTGAAIAGLTGRLWPRLPSRADDVPPGEDRRTVAGNEDGQGVTIVVNPGAGSKDDDFVPELRARLPRARIVELGDGGELEGALAAAADEAAVLGVAGGDGSMTAAAELALDRELPLLALPGGTLNHLARDLRAEDVDEMLSALADGEVVGVDVATIDGRPFLNSAGFGAYPEMLAQRERLSGTIGRWPAQLMAFIKTLLDARPLELNLNGTRRAVWGGFVGNCRYEPAGIGPSWRPRLDDGRLDVRLALADVRWSRARLILSALTGRLAASRAYREEVVERLEVRSMRPGLRLARDGEHFDGSGEFTIEKLPRRVTVFAPHRASQG